MKVDEDMMKGNFVKWKWQTYKINSEILTQIGVITDKKSFFVKIFDFIPFQ